MREVVGTLHARSRERTSCTRTSMRLFSAVLVIEMSEISEMSGVAGLSDEVAHPAA